MYDWVKKINLRPARRIRRWQPNMPPTSQSVSITLFLLLSTYGGGKAGWGREGRTEKERQNRMEGEVFLGAICKWEAFERESYENIVEKRKKFGSHDTVRRGIIQDSFCRLTSHGVSYRLSLMVHSYNRVTEDKHQVVFYVKFLSVHPNSLIFFVTSQWTLA